MADDDEEALCELIANGLQGDLRSMEEFEDVSDFAVDMLQGLLTVRPEERLPAAEAVEHPWFIDNMVGLQASTAKSLHYVHTRLQKLVTTTGQRGRQFEAGAWIIAHGVDAETVHISNETGVVYLVTQGECELLVRRSGGNFVRVGKRRQGNFVGEGQVLLSAHQLRSLAGPTPPTSPLMGSSAGPPVTASTSLKRSAGPSVVALSSPVSSPGRPVFGMVPEERSDKHALTVDIDRALQNLPSDTTPAVAKALGGLPQVQPLSLESAANGLPEQPHSRTSSTLSPNSPPQVSALIAAGGSAHLQTKHAVWVRAVTAVEAVELAKEDMQWALEDDYRLGPELREAMYTRRRELRAKQKQAVAHKLPPANTSPQSQWSPMWSPVAGPQRAALFDAMPDFVLDGDDKGRGGRGGGDPAFGLSPPATSDGNDDLDDGSLGYTLRLNDYKAGIIEMMQEYFQAQEVGEVAARLAELQVVCGSAPRLAHRANVPSLGEVFVKKAVVIALDFSAREFELTAVLISALAPGMLKAADIGAAFKKLFGDLNDVCRNPCCRRHRTCFRSASFCYCCCFLTRLLLCVPCCVCGIGIGGKYAQLALDVPTAPSLLPLFFARFVLDETLPSTLLKALETELTSKEALKALRAADALLSSPEGTAAVLHAWGGGGAGSVAHSKQAFAGVLREYTGR